VIRCYVDSVYLGGYRWMEAFENLRGAPKCEVPTDREIFRVVAMVTLKPSKRMIR
jgi:hypothetical protein